jgi:hypothetical protein
MRARKWGSDEIHPGELMPLRIDDEKFLIDLWFMFGMLPTTTGEDNDHEHPAQEQEGRCTMTIGFDFH